MKAFRILILFLTAWAMLATSSAQASSRFSIGFSFGAPFYRSPGWCPPRYIYGYHYVPSYPVYVDRPVVVREVPVVVEQPRVLVQPQPVPQPAYPSQSFQAAPPAPQPSQSLQPVRATAPPPLATEVKQDASFNQHLEMLRSSDEQTRSQAALQLGRLKSEQAVYSLAATLTGDPSPEVREAAARALGLIGSPRGLASLTHAAQTDTDRDVRRTAQFAVDIIQTNQRQP